MITYDTERATSFTAMDRLEVFRLGEDVEEVGPRRPDRMARHGPKEEGTYNSPQICATLSPLSAEYGAGRSPCRL